MGTDESYRCLDYFRELRDRALVESQTLEYYAVKTS
jgi:hypothetical protein